MNIIIAENAGFCFGVKRAMDMATAELNRQSNDVFSHGPLIHNPQAVELLEKQGLKPIKNIDKTTRGSIVIRSHGVPKSTENEFIDANLNIVDCTCPYVKAVHKRVESFDEKGYNIVIIGEPTHPEIIGINGWCNNKAYIVNDSKDATNLPNMDKVCIVSQTTNTLEKFESISKIIESKANEVKKFNTICMATKNRQDSAAQVASIVDAMVVLGGYHSSNTIKLTEISSKYCDNVYHVQTIKDLSLQELSKFNTIGVTAGASTPDWIIKEAVEVMDNLNNNEMMEAIESSFTRIHRGDIVEGKVIFVTKDEVMVNINYKSDGIITRDELSNDPDVDPKDLFKEGDEIQVYVVRVDDGEGNVVLSAKRVNEMQSWDILEEKFESQEIFEVKVLKVVKGGLIALVDGINGFIPASHVSANYVTDLDEFKGQVLKVRLLDFDRQKRRVILSRKNVEKEELEKVRKEFWNNLEANSIVKGTVQRLTNFGAFVDLGGVDGLIHISDLSWHRVKHPSEIVQPGDTVEVQILDFNQEKNRISLGLKQTIEEPWEVFKRNVTVGDIVEGTIVNLLEFGAFVRLDEGVDGLLHVSQISKDHIEKPSDALKIGERVTVKVIDVDFDEKRISLSKKDAEEIKEESNDNYTEDTSDATIGDIVQNTEE